MFEFSHFVMNPIAGSRPGIVAGKVLRFVGAEMTFSHAGHGLSCRYVGLVDIFTCIALPGRASSREIWIWTSYPMLSMREADGEVVFRMKNNADHVAYPAENLFIDMFAGLVKFRDQLMKNGEEDPAMMLTTLFGLG